MSSSFGRKGAGSIPCERFDSALQIVNGILDAERVGDEDVAVALIGESGSGEATFRRILDEADIRISEHGSETLMGFLATYGDLVRTARSLAIRELQRLVLTSGRSAAIFEYLDGADLCMRGETADNPGFVFLFLESFRPVAAPEAQRLLRAWRYERDQEAFEKLLPSIEEIVNYRHLLR